MSTVATLAPPEAVAASPAPRAARVGTETRSLAAPAQPERLDTTLAAAGEGRPLDEKTRTFFERRFVHDFSRVRVHAGAAAAGVAHDLEARALTAGSDVVFGRGQYAPGTVEGDRLIAHELTHVVQQAGTASRVIQRAPAVDSAAGADKSGTAAGAIPALPYKRLAREIYDAIAGPGTDEEAIYRALQALERNPSAVTELKRVYQREHNIVLMDDLEDDLDGDELEFALELMQSGPGKGRKRIERGVPAEPLGLSEAAARLRAAVQGGGTDEEAIYAVLVPFRKRTLPLQREYQAQYKEDLRDRLVEEMEGNQLDYALSLFETPYEFYLQEGNARLAGAPFGKFGDTSFTCLPEERTMSEGVDRTYWYDRDYWEPNVVLQEGRTTCQVQLLPGKDPAEAIDAMFDHQDRWKIACAEFVQIVHLYALRKSLGAKMFNARVTGDRLRLELQRRQSTGVVTAVTFSRLTAAGSMARSDTGQIDERSVDAILAEAPIGSRVRWTNKDGAREQGNPWQHENTIKLGPDKFAAHGTASGVLTKTNTHTREEVERATARGTDESADDAYVRANIFISEIEIFDDPMAP